MIRNHLNVQYTAEAATFYFFSDGSCKIFIVLNHGSPTRSPPGCIMWPAATFVNHVYTIKITQKCMQLGIPLIVIFSLAAHKPADNNRCGPLPKNIGCPCFKLFGLLTEATASLTKLN
jgi:hypothetical protein